MDDEPEEFQKNDPEEDEIMEVNVPNEEIRDDVFSDRGGWFTNLCHIFQPLLRSKSYIIPHIVEGFFDTIRQWTMNNGNNDQANSRNREIEEQLESVKNTKGYWENIIETASHIAFTTEVGLLFERLCAMRNILDG